MRSITIQPFDAFDFPNISATLLKELLADGMKQENAEVEAIASNVQKPNFHNTIEALEYAGEKLKEAQTLMYNLHSAETNDALDALADEMAPQLSEHATRIAQNEALFERIRTVWENREELQGEELRLTKDTYLSFVRSGAALKGESRTRYSEIAARLSALSLQFSNNLRHATNTFSLHITEEKDLSGLPEGIIEQASATAQGQGKDGWIFTLKAPSYVPFMTYADNRALREKMHTAYSTRCTDDTATSNFEVVRELVALRLEKARLLGYETYADYVLERRMAENTRNVEDFLEELILAFREPAEKEVEEVIARAKQEEGDGFEFAAWDFAYYAQKLQRERYDIDSEMLRPYFELSKVIDGVFHLATRLYGITFRRRTDIPTYHEEVEVHEVLDTDDGHLALLYVDFHPREGKQGGAWMTNYREQHITKGEDHRPHVSLVMNFTRSTPTRPSLLTLGEVETFLHEFGHALHSIFSKVKYESLSGTNVKWDFVELPSQFMENFATEKEFLQTFAHHYQTGEVIPDELIQRIIKSRNFNAAYACMRQVSFGLLDMAFYTLKEPLVGNIRHFEKQAWAAAQLLPTHPDACMSVQFSHIMAGGYSAGYYSYKWAEVLDADAFSRFKECGIFNRNVAQSWRENVLSKGGTTNPMELFVRFRGRKPTMDALLERSGIKK